MDFPDNPPAHSKAAIQTCDDVSEPRQAMSVIG